MTKWLHGEVLARELDANAYACWIGSRRFVGEGDNVMARETSEVEILEEPKGEFLIEIDDYNRVYGTVEELRGVKQAVIMKWRWSEPDNGWKRTKGFGVPAAKARELVAGLNEWVNRGKRS